MLPAARVKLSAVTFRACCEDAPARRHQSDHRYRNACNSGWDAFSSWRGEEQFVVFAAVQRKFEIDLVSWTANLRQGNGTRLQVRTDTALLANVHEIDGEAIAKVDHGRSKVLFSEKAPDFDPRCGSKMWRKVAIAQLATLL